MTGSTPKGPAGYDVCAEAWGDCDLARRHVCFLDRGHGHNHACVCGNTDLEPFVRRAVAIASGGDGPDTARTPTRSELPGDVSSAADVGLLPRVLPSRAPGAPPLNAKET